MLPSSNEYELNPEAWSNIANTGIDYRDHDQVEVRLQWKPHQTDIHDVARSAIEATNKWFDDSKENGENEIDGPQHLRETNLVSSMKTFIGICESHLTDIEAYKLKLHVMRGATATRCPMFHADNIPARWIQAMVGPGCEYLDENDARDNPYLSEVHNPTRGYDTMTKEFGPRWKIGLVEKSGVTIQRAPTGQPLVIGGCRWTEFSKKSRRRELGNGSSGNDDKDEQLYRSGVLHQIGRAHV